MIPRAFAFCLHEVPFVASTMRALGVAVPSELRDAAHYVFRSADEGCAHVLHASDEPEVDEAVTADLMAIDEALAAVLEEQWPGEKDGFNFGFHAGLSFDDAVAALTRGGFDVRSFPKSASGDGWHAAERLASNALDEPSLIEDLVFAVPEPLWRLSAMKRAAEGLLAKSPMPRFTAPTLARLLELGAASVESIARAAEASAHDSAPRPAVVAPVNDLAPMIRAMRCGSRDRNACGEGVSAATLDVLFEDPNAPAHFFANDIRWSRDGARVLLVLADAVRVFERTDERGERAENVAHGFTLKPVIEYPRVPRRKRLEMQVALSADFLGRERIVTGHGGGELRSGPTCTNATTHDVVQRFAAPVLRVRSSPRGKRLALVVGDELVLTNDDGAEPRVLGKAGRNVAWAPDGASLAVCEGGELVVYDAAGVLVRRVRVAESAADHGPHDASQVGFVVPTTRALVVVGHDGAVREVPCLRPREPGRRAGAASAAPDGRVVMVSMMWDSHVEGPVDLQVFDLANDRAHLWGEFAWHPPQSPLAFAPTGDGFASASRTYLRVEAWSLDFARDEAGEWQSFVRSLILAGHYPLAKLLVERIPVAPHRQALARAIDSDKRSLAVAMPRPSPPPAPLPKAPPKRVPTAPANTPFAEGQAVVHARFGRGIVEDVDGEGQTARVTVDFEGTQRVLPATSLRAAS